jgi:crotonobetainyl-CoA:carnitine CoA-transferase CaiB-like acyl-CoA transferase
VATGTIWVAISAYGRDEGDRVGFGDDVAAAAGLVVDDGAGPYPVGDAIADPLAGVTAAAAASVALRSGRGWLLDVSMRDVAAAAARLTADEAAVIRRGDRWWVGGSGAGDAVPVREPRARAASAQAPELGAHTSSVLAEFDLAQDQVR